jgi:hypothetical protein
VISRSISSSAVLMSATAWRTASGFAAWAALMVSGRPVAVRVTGPGAARPGAPCDDVVVHEHAPVCESGSLCRSAGPDSGESLQRLYVDPHAVPFAFGGAIAKEIFDLLGARLQQGSVLSYLRATRPVTSLRIGPASES